MKKLFMFLAVAGLATFGASCSSDDSKSGGNDGDNGNGNGNGGTTPQLVLSADKTTVNENDSVTFTVKVGKDVVDADLYIQGTPEVKIDKTHKFTTKGQYKVIAKKKDHKDSSVVTITVKEEGTPSVEKKLVLTPSKTEAFVGDVITFTVKDEDGANVNGYAVKQANGTAVPNGLFSTTVAGTYKFVASKDGYISSEEVSVVFEAQNIPANYTKLNGEYTEITNLKRVYIHGRKNAQGQWQPHIYSDDNGTYSIVTYELGSINAAGTEYVTRSSTSFITMQVIGQAYQFPANVGQDTFIINSAVVDFNAGAFVDFNLETDLVDLDIPDSDTEFLLNLHVESDVNAIKFDGSLGGSYYWREVDANGNLVPQGAVKAKVSAQFLNNAIYGGKKK